MFHCRTVWNLYWTAIGLNTDIPFLQKQVSCIQLVLSPENSAYSSFNWKIYIYIRSRSIWLHFLFHVYSDKIDQILDDAETTESMVNQILYRTFTYQKCHDKALLPTGAEVTIPFMYWLLETWSEWGKAETGKKSTTNCDWKKNHANQKGWITYCACSWQHLFTKRIRARDALLSNKLIREC